MTDERQSGAVRLKLTEEQKKLLRDEFGDDFVARISAFDISLERGTLSAVVVKN